MSKNNDIALEDNNARTSTSYCQSKSSTHTFITYITNDFTLDYLITIHNGKLDFIGLAKKDNLMLFD